MTEVVVHATSLILGAAMRLRRLAARLGGAIGAIVLARATHRALNGLPDEMLKDIGLQRGDIPFVANAIAHGDAAPRRSSRLRLAFLAAVAVSACAVTSHAVLAQPAQAEGDRYVVRACVMQIVPPQAAVQGDPAAK